jgi:hypothetical protein
MMVSKRLPCGLYYTPMTIVNDDTRVINKLEASLTDDARVVIYDCYMFIVQATVKPAFCMITWTKWLWLKLRP